MPGFEHGTSRVKSDQFADWATTIWILSDKLVSNHLNVNVIWTIMQVNLHFMTNDLAWKMDSAFSNLNIS